MSGYVRLQHIPYRGHDLLARAVLDHSKPGDRILEGGVSSGYFAKVLVDAGRRVDGIEIDPVAAEEARSVCDRVIVADLQAFDPSELPGDYDVLLFGDTLEHLPDPAAVLRRLHPKLKPGGVLVTSVPNVANWAMRLALLLGRFRYTERGILDHTHLRFYTKRTLIEMLNEAGFGVGKVVAAVPIPGVRSRVLCALFHRVGNLWPSLFGYQFIVIAVPRPH